MRDRPGAGCQLLVFPPGWGRMDETLFAADPDTQRQWIQVTVRLSEILTHGSLGRNVHMITRLRPHTHKGDAKAVVSDHKFEAPPHHRNTE